jgi:5'-nucleotidase
LRVAAGEERTDDVSRPLILVTNDDGVLASGIAAVVEAVEGLGEVLVCAPDTERSGSSHAITFHTHLRMSQTRDGWWHVSGTPVDCVYLALLHLCPRPPALVISGINAGYNLGTDVFYSGTVGAAAEAYMRGVVSLAMSTDRSVDPRVCIPVVRGLAQAALAATQPMLLNVNIPAPAPQDSVRGPQMVHAPPIELTCLGKRVYKDLVEPRTDPQGRAYYWIGGPPESGDGREGHDTWAVQRGRVSVTPLEMDITAPDVEACRNLLANVSIAPMKAGEKK